MARQKASKTKASKTKAFKTKGTAKALGLAWLSAGATALAGDGAAPNHALHLTASSLRSYVASASGSR